MILVIILFKNSRKVVEHAAETDFHEDLLWGVELVQFPPAMTLDQPLPPFCQAFLS